MRLSRRESGAAPPGPAAVEIRLCGLADGVVALNEFDGTAFETAAGEFLCVGRERWGGT